MTEILTESFCERCGTRYTFQTAAPGKGRVKRLKVLSRGLRNYVLSDETTLEEALADARNDEERAISGEQLDAFHQTFNFCMTCRQYTCGNCWNEPENLCLTCAPDPSREPIQAAFPDLGPTLVATFEPLAPGPSTEDREALAAASAWPVVDLPTNGSEPEEPTNGSRLDALLLPPPPAPAPAPEIVAEPESPGVTAEAVLPVADVEPPITPVDPAERARTAAAQTAALLARFRPSRSLDKALEAYEEETAEAVPPAAEAPGSVEAMPAGSAVLGAAVVAEAVDRAAGAEPEFAAEPEVAAEPEAVAAEAEAVDRAAGAEPEFAAERQVAGEPVAVAAEAAAEPEVAAEPEGAAEPEAVTESGAVAAEPEMIAAPEVGVEADEAAAAAPVPEPAPATAPPERRDDRVEIPTWQIVAPDATAGQPGEPPTIVQPPPARPTPIWPPQASAGTATGTGPQWPTAPYAAPAARARDAMWAASSLELVERAGGGVQSCVSCGLPLSATARFCRRCGSRQG